MKALLVFAFALLACGGDDVEPQFKYVSCDPGWGSSVVGCQAACQSATHPLPLGDACDPAHTVLDDGQIVSLPCTTTLEWQGLQGCCESYGSKLVQFFQCD